MRWAALIGTLAGVGLAAALLVGLGIDKVLGLLAHAGGGILLVLAFHATQLLASAAAWRALAGPTRPRPSLGAFVLLRWIREGVNNLLPVAQIGGEVVAARLLRRQGVSLADGVAGTIGDLTMEMLTQIGFTLLGLGLLLLLVGESGVGGYVLGGVGLGALAAVGFVAAQWFGGAGLVERTFIRLGRRFGWPQLGAIEGLDAAVRGIWRRPRFVLAGAAWHFASWLLGGVEVWLALRLLGAHVGPGTGLGSGLGPGLVIEALGQALKSAGFAIPGGLGVAEGGYIVACHLFGLPADVGLALGLIKRLREIVFGLPALAAWHLLERRTAETLERTT